MLERHSVTPMASDRQVSSLRSESFLQPSANEVPFTTSIRMYWDPTGFPAARELQTTTLGTGSERTERAKSIVATSLEVVKWGGPAFRQGMRAINREPLPNRHRNILFKAPARDEMSARQLEPPGVLFTFRELMYGGTGFRINGRSSDSTEFLDIEGCVTHSALYCRWSEKVLKPIDRAHVAPRYMPIGQRYTCRSLTKTSLARRTSTQIIYPTFRVQRGIGSEQDLF